MSDFIEESKVSKEKVFRLERRLGVPGKIWRIFKRIDNLSTGSHISQTIQIGDGKPGLVISQRLISGQYEDEIENIKKEIIQIIELLENQKDRELFIESLPNDFKDKMPDDFAESLLRLPRKDIYRKEDEPLLEVPVVKKLPPPD